jgi:integrase
MCMNRRRFREVNKDPLGRNLLAELADYGNSRGWAPDIITIARGSLRVILAHRDRLGDQPWCDVAIREVLNDSGRKANQRVIEFLVDQNLAETDTDHTIDRWLTTQLEALRPQIATEVRVWVQVLRGQGNRPRIPLQHQTIRSYIWILQQPLTAWSATYGSLREVTVDDVNEQLQQFIGAKRDLAASAMRSMFKTLKVGRVIFTNPTTHLRGKSSHPASPIGLSQTERAQLLQRADRPADQLMVLLAGVHALRAGQIATLRLDDVDTASRTLRIRPARRLDTLTLAYLTAWLEYRRQRWPRTANPYLLVNQHTAGGVQHVATGYVTLAFRRLGHTAQQLRVDRFLDEVHSTGGDPIRLIRLFGLSDPTALRYCAEEKTVPISSPTPPQGITDRAKPMSRNHYTAQPATAPARCTTEQ